MPDYCNKYGWFRLNFILCLVCFLLLQASIVSAAEKAEIFVQLGHGGDVEAAAFSPDGRTIASGSDDSTLKLWDAASGRELRTLRGHSGNVLAIAFSPDGRTIISGSNDNTLKLWNAASGTELRTLRGHGGGVLSVAFSPDGRTVISGSGDETLKLWDVASGQELRTFSRFGGKVRAVAFSPDGRMIVSGSENEGYVASDGRTFIKGREDTVKFWDAASGRELRTLRGHIDDVRALAISPDGRTMASADGDQDNTISLWDVASGRKLRTLRGHDSKVISVAFSPNGHSICSGSLLDGTLKLWDTASGVEKRTIVTGHGYGPINAVAFSPDGSTIISGSGDQTVKLWDTDTGRELRTLAGHIDDVKSIALSPDGHRVVLGGISKNIKLWDVTSGRELHTLHGQGGLVDAVAFSPDGNTILSKDNGILKLWDTASGRELRTLRGHGGNVNAIAFSPDGRTIASSASFENYFKLWDAGSGRERSTLRNNSNIYMIIFSPDGRTIVTGDDNSLKLWNSQSGKKLRTLSEHNHVVIAGVFSPDGHTIASAAEYENDIKLWDAVNGRELQTLRGHSGNVLAVAFSPDGRFIVSGSDDKTIRLWDIANGRELLTLSGHNSSVRTVVFSPDGKYIYSGSADGTARQWDSTTGKELAQFISFTDGEWIAITPEGYYNSSSNGAKHLNIRQGPNVYGVEQFYDVFYRPDIVQSKLAGEDISAMITVTIDEAIKYPPPSVLFSSIPPTTSKSTAKVCYQIKSSGGGIGEVRLFQNGKLIRSDGFYRDAVVKAGGEQRQLSAYNSRAIYNDIRVMVAKEKESFNPGKSKGDQYAECVDIDSIPGENEISVAAFNATNTVQSALETVSFTSARKPEEPHLYVLAIGNDRYRTMSTNLKFAAKDAKDFVQALAPKAATVYRENNIHVTVLANAGKDKIHAEIDNLQAKVKHGDGFILFIASHGTLIQNQYYIVTSDYNGKMDTKAMISSNEIVDISKRIKSLTQLFIFDTCHAGGVDTIISGLYDARMSVMAKKMGLHIYASAGSLQSAMDGYQGNGLYTYTLLNGIKNGREVDKERDGTVTIKKLGQYTKEMTAAISNKQGHPQMPLIINYGKDSPLFRVQ